MSLIAPVACVSDAGAIFLGLAIACGLYGDVDPNFRIDAVRIGALGLLLAGTLMLVTRARGLDAARGRRTGWLGVFDTVSLVYPALIIVTGLDHALGGGAALPPAVYVILAGAAPALIVGARSLATRLQALVLRHGWLPRRNVLLLLDPTRTEAVATYGTGLPLHRVMGSCRLPSDPRARRALLAGLIPAAGAPGLDEIHLALSWRHWSDARAIASELGAVPLPVYVLLDPAVPAPFGQRHGGVADALLLTLRPASHSRPGRALKRAFDVAAACLGLVMLAPLFVAVALAIRLDAPGPVFFRQSRGGLNGRPFRIYKFRSMRVVEDGPAIAQARRDDPRITAVGQWLRRTSIDELPQLLNVLGGEMSLVGPRPHALAHDTHYTALIEAYPARQRVKPGLTGCAQVSGLRGETRDLDQMKRRIDLDVWYASNQSFLLDLKIVFETVFSLKIHRSAF